MPQIFRIGSYIVYIWSDEGLPTEPIHVHVAEGRPSINATKKIIKEALPSILEVANSIASDKAIKDQAAHAIGQILSGPVNQGFNRFYVKADKFYAKDSCISCGKCETLCPLENISMYEGKPIWGKDCTHCMACICNCPTEAIEYGRTSYGKRRYKCPV